MTSCAIKITMKEEERTAIANTWTYHQDFPKPGINFVNILPLFQHQALVKAMVAAMAEAVRGLGTKVDIITAIESRGFLFGTLLAAVLDIPFVAIRKAGKLPGACATYSYDLEYGSASIQVMKDSVKAGQVAIVCDDLLATGGTAVAAIKVLEQLGVSTAAFLTLVELAELNGAKRLQPVPTYTIVSI